jgi:hypothetical protein
LCQQERAGPVPVLRWSPTTRRKIEAVRDRIFAMCGTDELVIEAVGEGTVVTMQWRKPLSIEEVNRMAPTPEVRERRGRP